MEEEEEAPQHLNDQFAFMQREDICAQRRILDQIMVSEIVIMVFQMYACSKLTVIFVIQITFNKAGWNTIAVNLVNDGSGQTTADSLIRDEASCSVSIGPSQGVGFLLTTDNQMFHCLGGGLIAQDLTTNTYTAENPFAGIISKFQTYSGVIDSSWFGTNTNCGSGCTGICRLCGSTGQCLNTYRNSQLAKYDFTESGPTWVSTHTDSMGLETSFNLAQDWEKTTPYQYFYQINYNFSVDDQGLYFRSTSKICNSGTFSITWNSWSAGFWFRQENSPGLILDYEDSSGNSYFSVSTTASGISVTINGVSYPQTLTITSGVWYYALVTVEKVSPTQSQVCVSMSYTLDPNCISFSASTVFWDQTSNKLCLGGGSYDGLIKTLDIFKMPLSNEEAKALYDSGSECVGGCTNCHTTDICFSTCQPDEYLDTATGTCVVCFYACSSCYGPTAFQCFSCFNDLTDYTTEQYVYAQTWCPACGDDYIYTEKGEECDDGVYNYTLRPTGGDGCSKICLVEELWTCTPSFTDIMGPSVCTFDCISSQNQDYYTAGVLDYQAKPCDDGNHIEDDGCSSQCLVDLGWTCSGGTWSNADTCTEICGDGLDYNTYECDDGNLIDGDGCDSNCKIEKYYKCDYGDFPWPDTCWTFCSPRTYDDGEYACQDDNRSDGDGCNFNCEVEKGWECTGGSGSIATMFTTSSIDTCKEVCGDSYNFNQYSCDDGNANYLNLGVDGCSWPTCSVDTRYICQGSNAYKRDVCTEICGDGVRYNSQWWMYLGASECDDGNQRNGDGCDSTCRVERGWTCAGGTTTTPDVCVPTCGDWAIFDNEFCDDGNNVSNDGCDANCYLEIGMECSGGYHYWNDRCNEICGDGRNVGYYICDDGNNFDYDGCSSTCTLEAGFQCTGGDPYTPDTCHEVCGDGFNLGTVECDDGNLLNGDGCDQNCKIELGYYCNHPTLGKDTCSETCGDGIMLGFFQCDDGNLIDSDGCSSKCTIESCWQCDGLSPTICVINPIDTIGFSNTTIDSDQTEITIGFNNSIILQRGFDIYKAIILDVTGPLAPYNVSWYLDKADLIFQGMQTSSFVLKLDWLDTQRVGSNTENMTVCIRNSSQLKHFKCNKYIEDTPCWTFTLNGAEHPPQYCSDISTAQKGFYVAIGQLGLGLLISLGGHSTGAAWNTIYMLQYMHMIPVMSLTMPSCGAYFFQELDGSYLNQSVCQDPQLPDDMKPPTYNFNKMGFETRYFLYNMVDTFTFVGLISLIIPLVSIVKVLLPKDLYLTNADNFIKGRFLVLIVNLTYLKVCMLAFLNYFNFNPTTQSSGINSFASIAALGYVVAVPIYYLFQTLIFFKELRHLKKMLDNPEEVHDEQLTAQEKALQLKESFRAKTLFEDYNTQSIFQYGFMLQFTLNRIAYAVVITNYTNDPDMQLFILSVITIVNMGWIALFQPYKYPYRNILSILNELALFYIFSTVAGWTRNDLFCSNSCSAWRAITKNLVKGVTFFIYAQAGIWLVCQITYLIGRGKEVSPLNAPVAEVPKTIIKDPDEEKTKETEPHQKQVLEEEFKEEPPAQMKSSFKYDQSYDRSDMSQSLVSKNNQNFTQSDESEEDDDIETIKDQTQSLSNINETDNSQEEEESEPSEDLERDESDNETNTEHQNQTNVESVNESKDDDVPQSSFQSIHL